MPSECRRTEAGEAVLHARSWHARLLDAVAAASGMTPINACEVAREVDELETRRSVFSHIERGLTATFWRHDHLEGRRFGQLAGSNCEAGGGGEGAEGGGRKRPRGLADDETIL